MTASILLLLGQATSPALILEKDTFLVRGLGKEVREPIARQEKPTRATYRKDDAFAVWDARGLSIRHGKFSYTTRLPEVALTPKLFAREQIIAIRDSIAAGQRFKDAKALSGSRRIGDDVYFLVRWEDKAGQPWLEALVKVNLSLEKPKPELVGRFEGLSTATEDIDDQLVLAPIEGGVGPAAFVKQSDGPWGLGWFDRLQKKFESRQFGEALLKAGPTSGRLAIAVEKTAYGKNRVIRLDLVTGSRRDIAEVTGIPAFVDGFSPVLAKVQTNQGQALRNFDTGVQMTLPDNAVVRRTEAGILVWPGAKPELAAVYSPERFLRLATVGKPTEATVDQSKPRPRKDPPPR